MHSNANERITGSISMLSKTMEEALNRQVNREFYSAYLYLAMSAWFESQNLKGFAQWMRAQSREERVHGEKIFDYILARGGRIALGEIEVPKDEWDSAGTVFEDVYSHEQKVTAMIHNLVELATNENDPATLGMLQWFVKEQVEEEASASDVLARITMQGNDPDRLLALDHEMGRRE